MVDSPVERRQPQGEQRSTRQASATHPTQATSSAGTTRRPTPAQEQRQAQATEDGEPPADEQQRTSIRKRCAASGREEPAAGMLPFSGAGVLIRQRSREYNDRKRAGSCDSMGALVKLLSSARKDVSMSDEQKPPANVKPVHSTIQPQMIPGPLWEKIKACLLELHARDVLATKGATGSPWHRAVLEIARGIPDFAQTLALRQEQQKLAALEGLKQIRTRLKQGKEPTAEEIAFIEEQINAPPPRM